MKKKIKSVLKRMYKKQPQPTVESESAQLQAYFDNGQIPWSKGYGIHKERSIEKAIYDDKLQEAIRNGELPDRFGYRLDERIVEYAWIFANLSKNSKTFLDAGSTFNFEYLVNHPTIEEKELTVYTYAPEAMAFFQKRISYVYGDLRAMYFKDESFDVVVSQSTIEHIDMDNSMYGYAMEHNANSQEKSYEYISAIREMERVLKTNGQLLLTFPYGRFENHGFFQQFDAEMLLRIRKILEEKGTVESTFFRYEPNGWVFSSQEEANEARSFNPHTGEGKGDDNAAHSRAIACLKFNKR